MEIKMDTDILSMRITGLLMFIVGIFLGALPLGSGFIISGVVISCTSLIINEIRKSRRES